MTKVSDSETTITADPARTPCARQLQTGVAWLRFDPPLEAEYRARYVDQNIDRFRIALRLGIALICVVALIDFATLAPEIRARVALAKLVVLLPVPLLALWVVHHPFFYRFASGFVAASIIVASLGIVIVHTVIGHQGWILPYDSLLLAVIFAYFLSGLLLPWSAICALTITGACVIAEWWLSIDGATLLYHGFHLAAANVMGLLGSYLNERTHRMNFLHAGAAEELAGLDTLTNLANQQAFADQLRRRWEQAISDGVAVGLLLIDIDYFRRYNDSAGHVAAEKAIQRIARRVQGASRSAVDVVARNDDDEFALLLYAVDRNRVADTARRLLAEVDQMRLQHDDSPISDALTVSIGAIYERPSDPDAWELFLARGHEALAEAKRGERHRVHMVEGPSAANERALRAS